MTQDPDDIPLQTEESSPPPAETPSKSAGEEPSQIRPQIIADFVLSQIADEDFEAPNPLIIRPADTSVEIDPGYTPEILLEGAADTAEILSCMVNGSEAEYEWKENKICLKAESLSEGYNRITVKVRGAGRHCTNHETVGSQRETKNFHTCQPKNQPETKRNPPLAVLKAPLEPDSCHCRNSESDHPLSACTLQKIA